MGVVSCGVMKKLFSRGINIFGSVSSLFEVLLLVSGLLTHCCIVFCLIQKYFNRLSKGFEQQSVDDYTNM